MNFYIFENLLCKYRSRDYVTLVQFYIIIIIIIIIQGMM
jgi:hypothetical protein